MSEKFTLYDGAVDLVFDDAKHQYKVGGIYTPSVTTVLGIIAKPALVGWAAKMAAELIERELKPGVALDEVQIRELAGRAKSAHRDASTRAAGIGTDVHAYAERVAAGLKPALPIHPAIRAGADAYHKWLAAHDVRVLHTERKVYSRKHNYAGTVDLIGTIDGHQAVVDFKTSSGIYDEYRLQIAAYKQALIEEGIVDHLADCWAIRFDKETGEFEAVKFPLAQYEQDARGFRAALALYTCMNNIKLSSRKTRAA